MRPSARSAFARYLFLNTRSRMLPEIGDSGHVRYATLHVSEHVVQCYLYRSQVRQRFPRRSLKPFPHTQGFDQILMRTSLPRPVAPNDPPFVFPSDTVSLRPCCWRQSVTGCDLHHIIPQFRCYYA